MTTLEILIPATITSPNEAQQIRLEVGHKHNKKLHNKKLETISGQYSEST